MLTCCEIAQSLRLRLRCLVKVCSHSLLLGKIIVKPVGRRTWINDDSFGGSSVRTTVFIVVPPIKLLLVHEGRGSQLHGAVVTGVRWLPFLVFVDPATRAIVFNVLPHVEVLGSLSSTPVCGCVREASRTTVGAPYNVEAVS